MASDPSIDKIIHSLSTLLREERKRQGISMTRLAEMSGLSQSTISLIENHKRIPGMDVFFRIALALELDPARILNESLQK